MEGFDINELLAQKRERNKSLIEEKLKQLEEYAANLRTLLEHDAWHGQYADNWTNGYVARDVANLTSLVARQQDLAEAQEMNKKK